MSEVKRKYTHIGTVMQAKKKDPNDPKEAPRFYLKLEQRRDKDKNVVGETIFPITLANGVQLQEGDILSMFDKRAHFKRLVQEGTMTQAKADELSFIRYDVSVVETVGESDSGSDDINF